jgi:hypothetical protein
VNIGEEALSKIEAIMAEDTGLSELRFIERARTARPYTSYRSVIRVLHYSVLMMHLLGVIYAVSIL